MIGLGIETSCDETSLALVEDGRKLIHLEIYSQIEDHRSFRGVVPEIASRSHLEKINSLYEKLLRESGVSIDRVSYVAVTNRPGLMGSLMIGAQFARCLGLVHGIPLVAVDHLEAHLAVNEIRNLPKPTVFPYLGLLLSGGNSSIFSYEDWGRLHRIADTLDDSIGEAFDKAASILGLPYPGGPSIEKQARMYSETHKSSQKLTKSGRIRLNLVPYLLKTSKEEDIVFSFSGLKTAVLYWRRDHPDLEPGQVCFEFQESAFELVLRNLRKAVSKTGIRRIRTGGGVLANSTLQTKLEHFARENDLQLENPEKKIYCTDNAAMIASLGYFLFQKGHRESIDFKVTPKRIA
jgi:N6-L-threonylcarbamoyladenine synthase